METGTPTAYYEISHGLCAPKWSAIIAQVGKLAFIIMDTVLFKVADVKLGKKSDNTHRRRLAYVMRRQLQRGVKSKN